MVLVSQDCLDDLTVFDAGLFHPLQVGETSRTTGNVSRVQRVPLKIRGDSNHVDQHLLSSTHAWPRVLGERLLLRSQDHVELPHALAG